MDDNRRNAISLVRNKNMVVDAMGEPWVPPNSGHNDLMENMKAFHHHQNAYETTATKKQIDSNETKEDHEDANDLDMLVASTSGLFRPKIKAPKLPVLLESKIGLYDI